MKGETYCTSRTRKEFARLLIQRMQTPQPEQLFHDVQPRSPQRRLGAMIMQRGVEVLDNEILTVRLGQPVKVHEQIVPRHLLHVPTPQHCKGKVCGAPGKGRDDSPIVTEDIEGSAGFLLAVVVGQNLHGVICGRVAGQDGACGF